MTVLSRLKRVIGTMITRRRRRTMSLVLGVLLVGQPTIGPGVSEEVAGSHSVEKLLRSVVSLEAITFIRGRSIQVWGCALLTAACNAVG